MSATGRRSPHRPDRECSRSDVAGRLGGVPAVRTLAAMLEAYDRAGGGLVAGGLAYAALIALLPGLLLVLSVFGLFVDGPGDPGPAGRPRSRTAIPPLRADRPDRARAGRRPARSRRDPRARRPAVGVEPVLLGARLRDRPASSRQEKNRNEIVRTLAASADAPAGRAADRRSCSPASGVGPRSTGSPTPGARGPSRGSSCSSRRRSARSCCSSSRR